MSTTAETTLLPLLTHSRMACAKTCLRKHYFAYELGLRKIDTGAPLRMGSAYHLALETCDKTGSTDAACNAVRENYEVVPAWADAEAWAIECETVLRLFLGHAWRWQDDHYQVLATEQTFELPLVNPDTGRSSATWNLAGKIDRIVRLADGRVAVLEYKTTAMPLEPDSDYWRRLRLDQQISMYLHAARELGYDAETVIYDVTRKPGIRPKKPVKADMTNWPVYCGETMAGAPAERETPQMFGARLGQDLAERPDFYYARHEIPRLEADLEAFRAELWQIGQTLRDCQKRNLWFRNTSACLQPYRCEYFDLCSSGIDPSDRVPEGFELIDHKHPELAQTQGE